MRAAPCCSGGRPSGSFLRDPPRLKDPAGGKARVPTEVPRLKDPAGGKARLPTEVPRLKGPAGGKVPAQAGPPSGERPGSEVRRPVELVSTTHTCGHQHRGAPHGRGIGHHRASRARLPWRSGIAKIPWITCIADRGWVSCVERNGIADVGKRGIYRPEAERQVDAQVG